MTFTLSLRLSQTLLFVAAACVPLSAQWIKLPKKPAPLTAAGAVDLMGPVPRRADGKPDLTGPWRVMGARLLNNIAADMKPGEMPMLPWAEAATREHMVNQGDEPDANCLPGGVPKLDATPNLFKILSVDRELMVILYETFGLYRQLFMDGREIDLNQDYIPAWMGYSIAKWDGDTLVVDTYGGNGITWLDKVGHPTTESLHVTERFHRLDFGHMDAQITIDDPKAYSKPWTVTEHFRYAPEEFIDTICVNEGDTKHMPRSGK